MRQNEPVDAQTAPRPPSPSTQAPSSPEYPALTPEQTAILLQRLQTLEQRVASLERGDNALTLAARSPLLLTSRVVRHLGYTISIFRGKQPLPGLRYRLDPPAALGALREADERDSIDLVPLNVSERGLLSAVGASGGSIVARAWARVPATSQVAASAANATSLAAVMASRSLKSTAGVSRSYASRVVDTAVGVANAAKREALEVLSTAQAAQAAQEGSRMAQATQFAMSRQLLGSALCVGSGVSLALHLALGGTKAAAACGRSALLGSGLAAYALTLSNRVGAAARLAALIVLALCQRVRRALTEAWRNALFVYRTGRWFEKMDAQFGEIDQVLGQPSGNLGKTLGGAADAVRSALESSADWAGKRVSTDGGAALEAVGAAAESMGSWITSNQVAQQVGGAVGGALRSVGGAQRELGAGLTELQREWFESTASEGSVEDGAATAEQYAALRSSEATSAGADGVGVLDAASIAAQLLDAAADAATARLAEMQEQILGEPSLESTQSTNVSKPPPPPPPPSAQPSAPQPGAVSSSEPKPVSDNFASFFGFVNNERLGFRPPTSS